MRSTRTQLWREGGREGGRGEGEREGGRERGGRGRDEISELTECGQNNAQICTNQGKDNYHEYASTEQHCVGQVTCSCVCLWLNRACSCVCLCGSVFSEGVCRTGVCLMCVSLFSEGVVPLQTVLS